jgi:hypothetical protein
LKSPKKEHQLPIQDNEFSLLPCDDNKSLENKMNKFQLDSKPQYYQTPEGIVDQGFLDKNSCEKYFSQIIPAIQSWNFNISALPDFKRIINNSILKDYYAGWFIANNNGKMGVAVEQYFKAFYKANNLVLVYVFPDLYEQHFELSFIAKSTEIFSKPIEFGYNNFNMYFNNQLLNVNTAEIKIVGAIYLPQYRRLKIKLN